MKKIFIVFLFLETIINCIAQTTFKKDYLTSGIPKLSINELSSGNFFVGLGPISRIDVNGNVLYSKSYNVPPLLSLNRLQKYKGETYLFDGTIMDSCLSQQNRSPFLSIIDTNGNFIIQKKYQLINNCSSYTSFSSVFSNHNVISGGQAEITNCERCWTGDFYIFCTDSSLEVKWAKYYSGQWGGPQFGKQTPDGGFIIGLNLRTAGASLLKLDSMGNTVWCKSYIRPNGFIHDCLVEPDGSIIVTGYTDSTANDLITGYPLGFAPKLFMMKVDTSGQVLWCKGYDSDNHWLMSPSQIIKASDGNYVILASVANSASFFAFKPLLIKTDTNGDTLWTRSYGRTNYYYESTSIIQCSDRGYLYSGVSAGNYPQNNSGALYIYKTDSLGHTSCFERIQPTYVYNLFPTDSNLVLTSSDGGTAFSANAVYFPPFFIPTYDDCTLTGIVNPSVGLNNYSLRPNPSTGKIYLSRDYSYTSDCYYSVFNSVGKLLLQRIFPYGNKDAEIDLSRYGKGIYLINITEGIEIITRKVVIE